MSNRLLRNPTQSLRRRAGNATRSEDFVPRAVISLGLCVMAGVFAVIAVAA